MNDSAEQQEQPQDQYANTFRTIKEGELVSGQVVRVDRDGILVDIGTKTEGFVPLHELSPADQNLSSQTIQVGDQIDVYVLRTDDGEAGLLLSKKRADFEGAWHKLIEAHEKHTVLHAMVTDRVKGGLVVDLGIRGFVPASHVGMNRGANLDKLIGQSIPLKVIEVDRERRKVILSHRMALEEEREKARAEISKTLEEGQVREGVVRRLTEYGAFIDLGGLDGLLHISEMSWTRIKHPSEVMRVGDRVQVVVLKVNLEQGRISLGKRQIMPDPWGDLADQYKVGDILPGVVTRIVPIGAFVQLENGIEGIVPNIQLSERKVTKPEQVVAVGQKLMVKVLDLRPEERRMTLSVREAPQSQEFEAYNAALPQKPEKTRGKGKGEFRATKTEMTAEDVAPSVPEDKPEGEVSGGEVAVAEAHEPVAEPEASPEPEGSASEGAAQGVMPEPEPKSEESRIEEG